MKIAVLTSGIQPVPSVQGGAVENLIDFYLDYNDQHKLHDITIYSVWHPNVKKHPALKSEANHYIYVNTLSWWAKLKKKYYQITQHEVYYHYTVEYYLHEALKHIHRQQYDLIIIENRPGYILTVEKNPSTRYVLHLHNDFLNNETKASNEILNRYHQVISVSDYITNQVKTIDSNSRNAITVHNAINTRLFYDAKPFSRDAIGMNTKDFILIYSGRLIAEKGLLPLIQAIKKTDKSPIRILIIGASSYGVDLHPTPYIQQLQKEAEPIKDQIQFTGYIDYQQIPSYLKMADLAVVPSVWEEPFGLTVVEAMAAGLPLIATRSGGIPEICEGVAVLVDRDKIVDNLANAILDLYEHPEKRKAMSEASLERSKLFDKERYAKDFFNAIESIK